MGKRGPAPKPTALKIIEGNPGKQKIKNTGEPMPPVPSVVPKPPTRLLPAAKKEWKRLAPCLVSLGLLTEVDLSAFAELCQCYAYYVMTDAEILKANEEGRGVFMMQKTQTGYMQQHPLLSLRRQYYETWRRALADFGLTPASRARLFMGDNMPTVNTPDAIDPMEKLLSGGW